MRQHNAETEISAGMMDAAANSDANHHHHNQLLSTLQDHIHNHSHQQMFPSSAFDPSLSQEDFLDQMLSSSAAGFTWADDQPPPDMAGSLDEHPARMRQQQIDTKALMLQQQLLLSAGANGNDVVDEPHSSNSPNLTDDASIKTFLNGFTGSLGQTSNQSQHFHHPGAALQQSQNFGAPAMGQTAASGSIGGAAGQPKQRVRARRGQATDPHSIAERLRRERIAERMKSLQELVPNANKTDKASMLDEIIDYVKFLQLQVKVLSMSRLGGAAAVVGDKSAEGKRSSNGTSGASSSDGMTVAERQVAKLMEDDMGSAMQYLQGKGLCLMPISLATAISSVTRNPSLHGDAGGPTSPSISVLTGQSATMGGELSFKDSPKLE